MFNTLWRKSQDSIAVIREHRGRYEKIPEAIKSQPNWASLGIGESFMTNKYTPCSVRREFQNRGMTPPSSVAKVCCHKQIPCTVESQPARAKKAGSNRALQPMGSVFVDRTDAVSGIAVNRCE